MTKITLLAILLIGMVTFHTQAQDTEIVLTQSTDDIFSAGGVSCRGGDNSWYREYVLSDEGITTDVKVVGVEFGLESTDFAEEVKFYAYNFSGFPTGFDSSVSPTPLASGSIIVNPTDVGTIIRADFDTPVQVLASSTIVIRIEQSTVSGNLLYLGTTNQETKTSFMSSSECDMTGEPESVDMIGFPNAHHMINLIVVDETLSLSKNLIENVSVFPNPTTSHLNLKVPSSIEILKVRMFDILGKDVGVLYHNEILDTANLAQGVYMLKVETSQGILTKKIVKQ